MNTIEFGWYGKPQHEPVRPRREEQWLYGEPQHEVAVRVNVEPGESTAYLRFWEQYAQEQNERTVETTDSVSVPLIVDTPAEESPNGSPR